MFPVRRGTELSPDTTENRKPHRPHTSPADSLRSGFALASFIHW